MTNKNINTKLKRLYNRLNGSTIEYDLKSYYKILDKIKKHGTKLQHKTDNKLKQISKKLRKKAQQQDPIANDLLIESYALVREVAGRVLKLYPYDVQVIGGIVMSRGKLAQMETGEGKTLTALFPVYLHALAGKGLHVLTFNDYLARRDALWMGPVYKFLDLRVGYVQEGMSITQRQKAYGADITYLTAKEAGFDYLRDSLSYDKKAIVHRNFNYALIDEADSILIDEARIPLIIAGAADDFLADTYRLADLARKLEKGIDFEFDEYARNYFLTDYGANRVEKILNCGNLYAKKNVNLIIRLNCAIHTEFLLRKDVDYIVRDNKIELVDEFTGRIADKRRWPDGLQAALEAKENIAIQSKGNILNSITLQHFLKLYPKVCGMTATAQPAEEEFRHLYGLDIVVIPPNRPCIRIDHIDFIFKSKAEKNEALISEIIKVHKTKRPILVGTGSVEESVKLAEELFKNGIKNRVLNAKNDEDEAQIIAQAGRLGNVTISTNMAGRGTDIRLGAREKKEKRSVTALGGLYVIGTNKHESRRIDQQLRGRAGRQGDPGSSRYFTSFEDDLLVKYRIADLLPNIVLEDIQGGRIDNPIVKREVDRIGRIVEGQNLEIKKTLYKYSMLIEKQRQIVFDRRKTVLDKNNSAEFFKLYSINKFNNYHALIGKEQLSVVCEKIILYCIDRFWSFYLAEIADIREGIHLKRIGGQVPYIEFQKISVKMFSELLEDLDKKMLEIFNKIKIKDKTIDLEKHGLKGPSATWTYLINDNTFENILGLQFAGNIGMSIGGGMLGPLMVISQLLRKLGRKKKNRRSNTG